MLVSDRSEKLYRIAAANQQVESGIGLSENHLVPACVIHNRMTAASYKQRLIDADIAFQGQRDRLCTRFAVKRDQLSAALSIRDELFIQQPDIIPKRFSRDYDSFFLLAPFLMLASLLTFATRLPKLSWFGVLLSGLTLMFVVELANRRFRSIQKRQFRIADLVWLITLVAVNLGVWRAILAMR